MRASCTRPYGGSAAAANSRSATAGSASSGPAAAASATSGVGRRGAVRRGVRVLLGAVAAGGLLLATAPAAPADDGDGDGDRPEPFTIEDPRITESSGLAASRAHPGVYWTHNDSEDGPYVYAVDSRTGKTVATVTLQGVQPRDVEAISLGPGGQLYVADIGDNLGGSWSEVWIYRFEEPAKLRDTTVTPTRYTVQYADGPRDAESLMVHPKTGRVYIASKNDEKKGGVYAGPEKLDPAGVNTFQRVGRTDMWATDGAFSPDGTRLLLRSYFGAEMYRWTAEGRPEPIDTVRVPMQRQGESVTFTGDGRTLMFGSEGEGSEVEPAELSGKLLPEDAAAKEKADRARNGDSGRNGQDGGGNSPEENRNLLAGGLTLALAVGVWMALRRLFRRRRD